MDSTNKRWLGIYFWLEQNVYVWSDWGIRKTTYEWLWVLWDAKRLSKIDWFDDFPKSSHGPQFEINLLQSLVPSFWMLYWFITLHTLPTPRPYLRKQGTYQTTKNTVGIFEEDLSIWILGSEGEIRNIHNQFYMLCYKHWCGSW